MNESRPNAHALAWCTFMHTDIQKFRQTDDLPKITFSYSRGPKICKFFRMLRSVLSTATVLTGIAGMSELRERNANYTQGNIKV
jgi:hypothetical protein